MKLIFTIIIAIAGSVALARLAMNDPGLMVIAWGEYTIKLPFLLFALAAIAFFFALHFVINLVLSSIRAPKKIGKWKVQRNESSAQESTMKGYAALIEGDWNKAEKALLHKLESNKSPLLGYLGAAYAAQQQSKMDDRDRHLDDALAKFPGNQLAINLTRARLLIQSGEFASARSYLEKLNLAYPKNIPVLRLLAECYERLGDWHPLIKLLPKSNKLGAFRAEEYQRLERKMYDGLLASSALLQGGVGQSIEIWEALPSSLKKTSAAIAVYAERLISADEMTLAERLIRRSMNREFNSELAYLYGKVVTDVTTDQIKLCLSWTKLHEEDASLKLALAQLYMRDEEISVARDLLRQIMNDPVRGEEASIELAKLLERGGERDAAMLCYKNALSLSQSGHHEDDAPPKESGEVVLLPESPRKPEIQTMPVISTVVGKG